jgi:hypothetical protein
VGSPDVKQNDYTKAAGTYEYKTVLLTFPNVKLNKYEHKYNEYIFCKYATLIQKTDCQFQ